MYKKIQISPGVNVSVDNLEFELLKYVKKMGKLPTDKLNSEGRRVINKLLSKGLLTRSKRGNNVYIQLHRELNLSENQ